MLFSILLINRILARAGPSFFSSIKRNPWGEIRVTTIPLSTPPFLGGAKFSEFVFKKFKITLKCFYK